MAAVSPWPLDAELLLDLEESPGDVRLRTPMRVGPPKMRPLATSSVGLLQGVIQIQAEDMDTLENWGKVTLSEWCSQFLWTHPRTGRTRTMSFAQIPRWRRVTVDGDDTWYMVPIVLEVHP